MRTLRPVKDVVPLKILGGQGAKRSRFGGELRHAFSHLCRDLASALDLAQSIKLIVWP
jgi:hypothetical protein